MSLLKRRSKSPSAYGQTPTMLGPRVNRRLRIDEDSSPGRTSAGRLPTAIAAPVATCRGRLKDPA